jgi:hypothetical protein
MASFLRDKRGHAIQGFVFYDSEDRSSPLSFELQEPDDAYFKALGTLRVWLVRRLRELRDRAAQRAEAEQSAGAPPQPTGPRLVYLHAPPDSDTELVEIHVALESDGIMLVTALSPRRRRSCGLAARVQ